MGGAASKYETIKLLIISINISEKESENYCDQIRNACEALKILAKENVKYILSSDAQEMEAINCLKTVIKETKDYKTKVFAIEIIVHISEEVSVNQKYLCSEELGLIDLLILQIKEEESIEIKVISCNAIRNIARFNENKKYLCDDPSLELVRLLISTIPTSNSKEYKLSALEILVNLSFLAGNQRYLCSPEVGLVPLLMNEVCSPHV
jgi:hypothetical protein